MADGLLYNVMKNGALLFVIGIAVAFAAPTIVGLIGAAAPGLVTSAVVDHAAGSIAGALWTGVLFGTFGALHVGLTPAWDKLFGKGEAAAQPAASDAKQPATHVHIHNDLQLGAELEAAPEQSDFTKRIEQARGQNLAR